MLKIPRLRLISVFLMAAGLIFAGTAYAVSIPTSAMEAAVGINNGLNGEYYNSGPYYSIRDAEAFVDSNAPTATFMSTAIDYPNGAQDTVDSSTTLSNYLGADASSLTNPGAGANELNTSVFRFSGYISILEAFDQNTDAGSIDVEFTVGSDDGFLLRIGDALVTEFSGPRSFRNTSGVASFGSAGLYSLELIYYENFGGTGIEFSSSISGGGIVSQEYLFKDIRPVPEPSTMILFGIGLASIQHAAFIYSLRRIYKTTNAARP